MRFLWTKKPCSSIAVPRNEAFDSIFAAIDRDYERALSADQVGLAGSRGGFLRVQALKLRIAMKNGQLRVAARPDGVLKSGFPSLAQCIESFGLAVEATVSAKAAF